MGDKILVLLEKVITGPKSRFFWALIVVTIIIGIIVFPYIDANFLYYDRIEKRINNLYTLVQLTETSLQENEALNAEYQSILDEMEAAREKALFNATNSKDTEYDYKVKFFAGAGLWYIVGFILLFNKKNEKISFRKIITNIFSTVICLTIGSAIGWLFALVPTLGATWINAILTIVLQVFVLWLLIGKPIQ